MKRSFYNAADFIATVALVAVGIGLFAAIAWGLAGLIAQGARAVFW